MIPYRVVEAKRDGKTLSSDEMREFFTAYLDGEVEEYQMAAFLMAVFFNGLTSSELAEMTRIMIGSGASLDLSDLDGPRIDKHSTGGVGDKVSLALAPLVAELGVYVPMMSGRGLGHTGGTLDKLEAIPGFRTDLDLTRFRAVLRDVGCAMIGQTAEIAPLDRRLYDLRSVTATVPALPLIAASIMSKKLAEGLTGLVLDVKMGEGAFLSDDGQALALAETMVGLGESYGVPTVALATAMDRPLGKAVGNAVETAEAVHCLQGGGPSDLREVVVALAVEMTCVAEGAGDGVRAELRHRAELALSDGSALTRFRRLVEAQGGDPAVADDPEAVLPPARVRRRVEAPRSGWIHQVTPSEIGYGVVEMGGGRTVLGQQIDPSVGFLLEAAAGSWVDAGSPLGEVLAADEVGADRGEAVLLQAFRIEEGEPPSARPLISHRITTDGVTSYL